MEVLAPLRLRQAPSLTDDQAGHRHEFGSHLQPGERQEAQSYSRIPGEPRPSAALPGLWDQLWPPGQSPNRWNRTSHLATTSQGSLGCASGPDRAHQPPGAAQRSSSARAFCRNWNLLLSCSSLKEERERKPARARAAVTGCRGPPSAAPAPQRAGRPLTRLLGQVVELVPAALAQFALPAHGGAGRGAPRGRDRDLPSAAGLRERHGLSPEGRGGRSPPPPTPRPLLPAAAPAQPTPAPALPRGLPAPRGPRNAAPGPAAPDTRRSSPAPTRRPPRPRPPPPLPLSAADTDTDTDTLPPPRARAAFPACPARLPLPLAPAAMLGVAQPWSRGPARCRGPERASGNEC